MHSNNIIDIHSHILFQVDDGAQSLDESLRTLGIAHSEGIRVMVATPHYGIECGYAPPIGLVDEAFHTLAERAAVDWPDMRLYLGCELLCVPGLALRRVEKGLAHTMNGTRYLLLEFLEYGGFHESLEHIHQSLAEVAKAGWLPILAHAQRYRAFQGHREAYRRLVDAGVYLQINAYDLQERQPDGVRDITRWLADEQLAHFIGTDTHGETKRPPRMRAGVDYLYRHCPASYVDALVRGNAETMLAGGTVAL